MFKILRLNHVYVRSFDFASVRTPKVPKMICRARIQPKSLDVNLNTDDNVKPLDPESYHSISGVVIVVWIMGKITAAISFGQYVDIFNNIFHMLKLHYFG